MYILVSDLLPTDVSQKPKQVEHEVSRHAEEGNRVSTERYIIR